MQKSISIAKVGFVFHAKEILTSIMTLDMRPKIKSQRSFRGGNMTVYDCATITAKSVASAENE